MLHLSFVVLTASIKTTTDTLVPALGRLTISTQTVVVLESSGKLCCSSTKPTVTSKVLTEHYDLKNFILLNVLSASITILIVGLAITAGTLADNMAIENGSSPSNKLSVSTLIVTQFSNTMSKTTSVDGTLKSSSR